MTAAAVTPAHAREAKKPDFTKLTLEELMNTEITSVSKRPSKVSPAKVEFATNSIFPIWIGST